MLIQTADVLKNCESGKTMSFDDTPRIISDQSQIDCVFNYKYKYFLTTGYIYRFLTQNYSFHWHFE